MQKYLAKSAAAGAVVGLLSLAGMQLASAQDTTSTSTPSTTSSSTATDATKAAPTHTGDDASCPNMGTDGAASSSTAAS